LRGERGDERKGLEVLQEGRLVTAKNLRPGIVEERERAVLQKATRESGEGSIPHRDSITEVTKRKNLLEEASTNLLIETGITVSEATRGKVKVGGFEVKISHHRGLISKRVNYEKLFFWESSQWCILPDEGDKETTIL